MDNLKPDFKYARAMGMENKTTDKQLKEEVEKLEAEYGITATKEGFKNQILSLIQKEREEMAGEIERVINILFMKWASTIDYPDPITQQEKILAGIKKLTQLKGRKEE